PSRALLSFYAHRHHRHLHSFPTRRSSDLILTGETETGVTLFELSDGVDDGPVYGQRSFPIAPRSTIGELLAQAESAALELVSEVDRKSTRLNSSHVAISYAVFCLKKKKKT